MVFPLDQIADVGVNPSKCLKLNSCEIIFELFQPTWPRYLRVTDGQTDRLTDGRTEDILLHNRAMCSITR